MNQPRKSSVAIVGVLVASMFTAAAVADMVEKPLPPNNDTVEYTNVQLSADRAFGLVPLTVNLSGMMRTRSGEMVAMSGGQDVRIVIESPKLTITNSASTVAMIHDVHYEAMTSGPQSAMPLQRSIEIRRTGTYIFRVQVTAPDGTVLSSNDVSVRAL